MSARKITRKITIKPHPHAWRTHSIAIVEVKGKVWGISWAGTPTEQEVEDAWIIDRRAFEPYDEATGTFIRERGR